MSVNRPITIYRASQWDFIGTIAVTTFELASLIVLFAGYNVAKPSKWRGNGGRLVDIYIMMTSSNGNIFRITGPLCGEFTGPGEVPSQRPVTRSFNVFFDLHLNKRLSKQPWGWWFETPSWSLWRQCNDIYICGIIYYKQILYVMQHMYLNQDNRVNKTHMKLLLECFILLSHFVNVGSQFMDCDGVFQEVFVLVDWLLVCWCSNFRNFLIRVQFQVFFSGVWNCITYAQNSQPCFHE